ncbi:MAG: ATP-binding protein [Candidatus Omnitrophica bacterium]|nr:ATP-binding protein [Candidatus Omnitrophota bacterium]
MLLNESLISQINNVIILASFIMIIALVILLTSKTEKIKQLESEVDELKRSLDEMDEQAKLIIRTDIELNKLQEELDKKMSGLYILQRLSRIITTTLQENQIFALIEPNYIEELGFEKASAFLWNEKEKQFICCLHIGYLKDEIETVKKFIDLKNEIYLNLINNQRSISSLRKDEEIFTKEISEIFQVNSFILAPILPKEGEKGFLLLGIDNPEISITEGDEELVMILANNIGQALDNARLFEETWRAQQELEYKVEERTRQLTEALEEIKKVSQRKTDFISAVSHELRTPLTSIKGYASILLTGKLGQLPNEVRERLERINRHSDELVHLVNDLLDISRLESGRTIMKQEPQNLKEIIDHTIDLLAVQLKDKRIDLIVNIPEETFNIFVDRSQIERVFINLIGNAIKFTPEEGRITISSFKIKDQVQVDITDTGCGIPEKDQEKIFEEFYRVDNPINQIVKGTGLGLTLVKRIIEAHKGRIWVRSKESVGSTFSFTLPMST